MIAIRLACLTLGLIGAGRCLAQNPVIAIEAARLIDGTGREPIENAVVLVKGDKIEAVGRRPELSIPVGARVIDLGNDTILPGLIDAHAHLTVRPDVRGLQGQLDGMAQPGGQQVLRGVRNIRAQLLSGVTTLYVVGEMRNNDAYMQEAVQAGIIPGPRILPAGVFITTTAGHGPRESRVTNGPWEMRTLVRRNAENGADHVKLTITDRLRAGPRYGAMLAKGESNFTREEIQAAVDEAHRLGLKATAHANGESIRLALEAGIDSIQHGNDLTEELMNLFVKYKKGFVSTHTITFQTFFNEWSFLDNAAGSNQDWNDHVRDVLVRVRRENAPVEGAVRARHTDLLQAHRKGIPIAVGTDSMSGLLPLEIENLVEAGFTPLEAITAATGIASRVLDLSDVGTIEKGKLADIISVSGNPLQRIRDLTKVNLVMIDGTRRDQISFR